MVNSDFAYDEVDTIWGTFGGGAIAPKAWETDY